MQTPADSPYLVPYDGTFRVAATPTSPPDDAPEKGSKAALRKHIRELTDHQRRLYAQDQYALLLIFQAMDAAGKDSTIRAVMSGVDPTGCQVSTFKRPSSKELDHDFLWRSTVALPERGRIGIFNRSYYEEVLIVKVRPGILDYQRLPHRPPEEMLWAQRYESIRDHEKHLARNGTVIVKFWLNVSKETQRQRFLSRIDRPHKNWKFEAGDLDERAHWDDYMACYERALNETSRPWAPWYAIPADDKPYMRSQVATIIRDTLDRLDLRYPQLDSQALAALEGYRKQLIDEG